MKTNTIHYLTQRGNNVKERYKVRVESFLNIEIILLSENPVENSNILTFAFIPNLNELTIFHRMKSSRKFGFGNVKKCLVSTKLN